MQYQLDRIKRKVGGYLFPFGFSANVEDLGNGFIIEPYLTVIHQPHSKIHERRVHMTTRRPDFLDGLFINYCAIDRKFEVAEFQSGEKKDELWIYGEYRSLKGALRSLVKGNKRQPKKIWK